MKINYGKFYKKMDLLKDFNFAMIYIISKMLALLKNHLNYLKGNIFECVLRSMINFFFFFYFFHNIKRVVIKLNIKVTAIEIKHYQ